MGFFLTLDVGTTAVKAALFDEKLCRAGIVIKEYGLLTPEPDIVELPADVYWENVVSCIRELTSQTKSATKILAITCTTQGETLIPVDGGGAALHNAVVWLDARAKAEAAHLNNLYTKETFYKVTGIPDISPYCPVAKLMWFKGQRPDIYSKAVKFLLLEDYLVYRLTGRFVSNPSMMCTTGYMDIRDNGLWMEIIEKTGLDPGKIPGLVSSGTVVGRLTEKSAAELGLTTDVTVTSGAMDQAAAALGAGGAQAGFLSETTGTCLAVSVAADSPSTDHWSPVPVYSHVRPGLYLKIVVMQTAGIVLKWFRDEFCHDILAEGGNAYARMGDIAMEAPPLSRGLIVFPHFAGTYSNPVARGVFFGAGLETGRGCFIRAIMESVGYMLKESLSLLDVGPAAAYAVEQDAAHLVGPGIVHPMEPAALHPVEPIAAHPVGPGIVHSMGGGAKSALWSQIKADICEAPIRLLEEDETASMGAAILGGVAVKRFSGFDEAIGMIKPGVTYTPNPSSSGLYGHGYERYKKLYEQFSPLFESAEGNLWS